MLVSGRVGGLCGLLLGLPSLRLPASTSRWPPMAFAMIVNEIVMANPASRAAASGLPGPMFPAPLRHAHRLLLPGRGLAAFVTWLTWNVARRMWGRAFISIRDNPVAAQAVGVPVLRAKLAAFVFSGVTAGVAGAVFASLQSYITPDTFVFELSLFFFVCIIIGGRGSLIGPFLGTAALTALPERGGAAWPSWANLFYRVAPRDAAGGVLVVARWASAACSSSSANSIPGPPRSPTGEPVQPGPAAAGPRAAGAA
jgi:branched-chain amino acid transport system permease protein